MPQRLAHNFHVFFSSSLSLLTLKDTFRFIDTTIYFPAVSYPKLRESVRADRYTLQNDIPLTSEHATEIHRKAFLSFQPVDDQALRLSEYLVSNAKRYSCITGTIPEKNKREKKKVLCYAYIRRRPNTSTQTVNINGPNRREKN